MGTPEYVAPELIRGLPPDARVDIYAVGVILYRLLTGRVPFAGDSFMATLTAAPDGEPPRDRPARSRRTRRSPRRSRRSSCKRSLVKDRDQRYPTIRELSARPSAPARPPAAACPRSSSASSR
jgi:serine/threonine protein kinase